MKITYIPSGDCLIPDIRLTVTGGLPLGRYGRMRLAYLQEHKPALYTDLCLSEQLFPHLREIQETASRRTNQIMADLLAQNPAPDKHDDQMAWVRHMNGLKAQAEEIVLSELVCD